MAFAARAPLRVGVGSRRATTGLTADPAPVGRPVTNIGKYLIRPTARSFTGYEMLNADVSVLERVHDQYLKAYQLPPALQPKYLRKPEVLDSGRQMAISRGWTRPRSLQG